MIRIARVEQLGQDPVLRQEPPPARGAGEVLVRVRAAALNFADLLKAQGKYQEPADPPFVPGLEGAGEVLEAPDGSDLAPGARVAIAHPGTMAEIVSLPADALIPIPDSMSLAQAAGFQIAYGTSHLALTLRGGLRAGDRLAVLGAAGGVGLTAVEIGAALGARVIALARGKDKLEVLRKAGAEIALDSDEWADLRAVLRDHGGVDVLYDPVGAEPGEQAFGALRRGGRYLAIGFAGGRPPRLPLNHALVKNIAIHGFYWGGYRDLDPPALRRSMTQLFEMFDAGRLHPVAGATLPLERLTEGFDLLRDRKAVGKVIITL